MDDKSSKRADGVVGPKEIVTLLYKPNHKLFQVAFKADLLSGPMAKLSEALSPIGIRILHATVACPDGKIGSWNVFVDSEDFGVTETAVLSKLSGVTGLRELRMGGGHEMVVDEFFFPLVMSTMGSRIMLITQELFQRMLYDMNQLLGTGESVLAFQEGAALGSRYASGLRRLIRGDIRQFMAELAKLYSATGIGRCEFVEMDVDGLHFVVRMIGNIECEGIKSTRPNSQWIRGHLTGGATAAFDTPMSCVETKCMAMGSPHCEFELSKAKP